MKQTRVLILLFFALFLAEGTQSFAQKKRFDRSKQLIVGIKGGVNFTHPMVLQSHSVFSPTGNSANGSENKTYEPIMKNMGFQGGLFLLYRFTNQISAGIEGLFFQYRYAYSNTYTWADTQEGTSFTLEQKHINRLHYFEIPALVRYDINIRKITPFVQGGVYTGFLQSGISQTRSTQSSGQVFPASPTQNPPTQTNDRFAKVSFGVLGGAGVSYFAGKVMLSLGGNVRYSILPPTGNLHRYNDQASTSSAYLDVPDNIRLLNLELYISVGVPIGLKGGSQPKFGTNYCTF
ncbi:MAG: PorT family protein [Flavobacteriales bacterium]|nr:PorT family protein [Flavobacteriales bacterium]